MSDNEEIKRIFTGEIYTDESAGTVYPYFSVVNLTNKEGEKCFEKA